MCRLQVAARGAFACQCAGEAPAVWIPYHPKKSGAAGPPATAPEDRAFSCARGVRRCGDLALVAGHSLGSRLIFHSRHFHEYHIFQRREGSFRLGGSFPDRSGSAPCRCCCSRPLEGAAVGSTLAVSLLDSHRGDRVVVWLAIERPAGSSCLVVSLFQTKRESILPRPQGRPSRGSDIKPFSPNSTRRRSNRGSVHRANRPRNFYG